MVSRQILEQAFAEGGSVLMSGKDNPLAGKILLRPEDLPSDLDLAANDPDRQRAILAQMEADIAAKQAEIEALRQQLGADPAKTADTGRSTLEADDLAALREQLEKLTVAELRAEADKEGIVLPASVDRKADIVEFLLTAAKE